MKLAPVAELLAGRRRAASGLRACRGRRRKTVAAAVLAVVLLAVPPVSAQSDPADFSGFVHSSDKSFSVSHDAGGLCSDGTTVWVSDNTDELHAYTLETRASDSDKDIDLHSDNARPGGPWCNATTVWVPDHDDDKLYAYTLSDGTRDSDKDIDMHRSWRRWRDVWSDGTTMWVIFAWGRDSVLYAYKLDADGDGDIDADDASHADYGQRDSDKDIDLSNCSCQPWALWSNGTTMWVSDVGFYELHAYTLSDGARDSSKDFDPHSANSDNDWPSGVWYSGGELWVSDVWDSKIYVYEESDVVGESVGGL